MSTIRRLSSEAHPIGSDILKMSLEKYHALNLSHKTVEQEIEHFALIDESLVWHGGMNLLGKEDAWDNLIRVQDVSVDRII